MGSNFRYEILKISDILKNKSECKQLKKIIDNKQTNHISDDFAYVAKGFRTQFYGFLFVDQNIGNLKLEVPLKLEHLNQEERDLIARGHRTLTCLIELCLSEFKGPTNRIAALVDPYSNLKKIKINQSVKSFLTDQEMEEAVTAFQSGRVYKALKDCNAELMLQKIELKELMQIEEAMGKEIAIADREEPNEKMKYFIHKINLQDFENFQDVMLYVFYLIVALKNSLSLACQILYESMWGDSFTILNDDNIFRYSMNSNIVFNIHSVFTQKIEIKKASDGVGSLVLIDCHPTKNEHIHIWGDVVAQTISFNKEVGSSAKYTIVEVDDEMIDCINLINIILEKPISFKYGD